MADEELPGEIVTLTRDQYRDLYLEDYRFFAPTAEVGPGTQPYVDASISADNAMVLFADAVTIGNGTNLDTSNGAWLKQEGESEGVFKLPAAGGQGFVIVVTAVGGSQIFQGDELKDPLSNLRFTVQQTAIYDSNGGNPEVPIVGLDTGESTNLDAGTSLVFTNPRPGCSPTATVAETSSGEGLTGGRPEESDDDYRERIKRRRQNPPASGNDAEYQRLVENLASLTVQKCFTYPAIFGPGSMAFAFTLRPGVPGETRVPNGVQLNLAYQALLANEPADDGVFPLQLVEQPLTVVYRVTWSKGAENWVDDPRWPPYASPKVTIQAAPAPTALTFRVATSGPVIDPPQVGQTLAVFDRDAGVFRRKRIESFVTITPGLAWNIVCSAVSGASDTGYTPLVGQAISPWSDNLDGLVEPTLTFIDGLGPGELFATFNDPGLRQKRSPSNPDSWPSTITNKIIAPILSLDTISNAVLLEPSVPFDTPIGTPGVLVYIFKLTDLAIYGE